MVLEFGLSLLLKGVLVSNGRKEKRLVTAFQGVTPSWGWRPVMEGVVTYVLSNANDSSITPSVAMISS